LQKNDERGFLATPWNLGLFPDLEGDFFSFFFFFFLFVGNNFADRRPNSTPDFFIFFYYNF